MFINTFNKKKKIILNKDYKIKQTKMNIEIKIIIIKKYNNYK